LQSNFHFSLVSPKSFGPVALQPTHFISLFPDFLFWAGPVSLWPISPYGPAPAHFALSPSSGQIEPVTAATSRRPPPPPPCRPLVCEQPNRATTVELPRPAASQHLGNYKRRDEHPLPTPVPFCTDTRLHCAPAVAPPKLIPPLLFHPVAGQFPTAPLPFEVVVRNPALPSPFWNCCGELPWPEPPGSASSSERTAGLGLYSMMD
jgi:hypothetical protein